MKSIIVFVWHLILISNISFSQPVITSSIPATQLVCIGSLTKYEVQFQNNYSGCSFLWSIKSGTGAFFNGVNTGSSVDITWAEQKPNKVEVEVVVRYRASNGGSCTSPETATLTFIHILRTVFQEPILLINAPSTIDFCSTDNVGITVSQLFIPNTGTGSVIQTEVDNYEWILPAGWRQVGSTNTGTVNTNVNSITIQPVPGTCSKRGTVVVRGVANNISCPSLPVSKSIASNILLNSTEPTVTVSPPQGFTGTTSCNKTPVTFTAQIANQGNCSVSSYTWSVPPNTWTILSQSGNTVTMEPKGTMADIAKIEASVALVCGTTVKGFFTPAFNLPVISGSTLVCSSATYTLLNTQGLPITWASSNTAIATINSSGLLTRVGIERGAVTVSATLPCSVPVAPKPIWVGKPVLTSVTYDGIPTPISCSSGLYQSFTPGDHVLTSTALGTTSNPAFILNSYGSPYVHGGANGNNYNFNVNSKHYNDFEFTISSSFSNGCGSISTCTYFTNWATLTSPFPNPSANEFRLQLDENTELKSVLIYNSKQEQVFSSNTKEKEMIIETTSLPDGVYVVKVVSGRKVTSHQLLVRH